MTINFQNGFIFTGKLMLPDMKQGRRQYARHNANTETVTMSRNHKKICPVARQSQRYTKLPGNGLQENRLGLMSS